MLEDDFSNSYGDGLDGIGEGLGSVKDDLIKVISLIPGVGSSAASKFNEFEALIRTEAEAGAKNAIPMIKAEVRKEVTPYTIAAIALGGGGFLVGLGALLVALSAKRGSRGVNGSLQGTPDEHRRWFGQRARTSHQAYADMKQAIAEGDCDSAYEALMVGKLHEGRAAAEAQHGERGKAYDRLAARYAKNEDTFKAACVRPRK